MAVTGGAVVWSLAAGLHLKRSDIGGKAVTGSRRADSVRLKGATPLVTSPLCPDTKKRTSEGVLFFMRAGRGQWLSMNVVLGAAGMLFRFIQDQKASSPAVRQRRGPAIPIKEKFFQGGGRAREGGGTVFTKNVPPTSRSKKRCGNYSSSPAVSPSS